MLTPLLQDRFPWLSMPTSRGGRAPVATRFHARSYSRVMQCVTYLVLALQVWMPVLVHAQVVQYPNYPEKAPPVTPDWTRKTPPATTPNYPAKPAPTTTPNFSLSGGKTIPTAPIATGQTVPNAAEAQDNSLMGQTIRRAQRDFVISTQQPSAQAGNETNVPDNGTATINIRDIIPGTTGDTILVDSLNADPALIKGAGKQIRNNLQQLGCRTTHFVRQPSYTGGFDPKTLLVVEPKTVTLVPIPGSDPVLYSRVVSDSGEYWGSNIELSFPTLGADSQATMVLRPATPTTPGFELLLKSTPYTLPTDGTYFTYEPSWSGNLIANGGMLTTLGSSSDKFRWKGTFLYGSGVAEFKGMSYAVQRSYSGGPGPCAFDPASNPLDGVDYLQPHTTGIYALFDQTRTSPQQSQQSFIDSAWKPHPSRYDPDMTAVFNAAESLGNNSAPVYSELFSGCTFNSTLPGSTESEVHVPDIYHCQNLMVKAFDPNGCDGQRVFNFAPLVSQHNLLEVRVFKPDNWPRPSPTCTAGDTLSGAWIDPFTATHNFVCTRPNSSTYVPTIPGWTWNPIPAAYTGPITHGLPLVSTDGQFNAAPLADGTILQYNIRGVLDTPTTLFPWNITVGPISGLSYSSISATPTTAGTAEDNWNIEVSGTVSNAMGWAVYVDVYKVLINQINFNQPGCEKYVPMMADGFCRPKNLTPNDDPPLYTPDFKCTEDKNVGGFMDLGSGIAPVPANGDPVYGGIEKLLVPWGPPETAVNNDTRGGLPYVPVPNSCWKAHGGPMECVFPSGDIPCYIDAQGNEVCGATNTDGMLSNFGDPNWIDNCHMKPGPAPDLIPLLQNPACSSVNGPKQVCAPSALGIFSNVCYVYDVSYDCGGTVTVTNPSGTQPPVIQQCGATPLRCLGTQCHNPPNEASPDFTEAATAASVVEMMQHDLGCADGTDPIVDANGNMPAGCQIRIFPGKWYWCKEPIGHQIGLTPNCCADSNDAAAGVDPMIYVQAAMVGIKIVNLPIVQAGLKGIPGYTGFIESFETMSSALSGAANSTLSFLTNPLTQSANSATFFTGEAVSGLYTEVISQATPSVVSELGTLISGFQQELWKAAYDVLADALGETIAEMFVSSTASTTVTVGAEGAPVAGYGAGPILAWIGYAYLAYQVLQIIGHIVFACEKQELEMGLQRKVGNCHDVGGYCKTKAFLVGCVEWRNSSCCYKTPLARIVQEQVRAQLYPGDPYLGYNEPKAPTCDGLTIQQLSSANWSAIDLSEWLHMMQETGLISKTAQEGETKYGLGVSTNQTVLKLTPPADASPNYVQRTATNLSPKTSEITSRRVGLGTQPVCYTDPAKLPWYQGNPVTPGQVIQPIGGEGQISSCGTNCLELTLGKAQFHAFCGSGNTTNQGYSFNVMRPDLITSAVVTEATWDDHLQINFGGAPVFTSSCFFAGGDLSKTWCLTAASTVPVGDTGSCHYPETGFCTANDGPGPLAPIDVTSYFQTGGVVNTNTIVKTFGCGHGYAKVRITYTDVPSSAPNADDCIQPPPRDNVVLPPGNMYCSIMANPSAPQAGQTVNLAAYCTPTANSYTWTASAGCNVPVGNANATVTGSAEGSTCVYTLNAGDGTLSTQASVAVTYGGNSGNPSMMCSMSPSKVAPIVGVETTLLTISCMNGIATSYVWTGCASTSQSCTATASAAGTVTYSAVVNGNIPVSTTVQWRDYTPAGEDYCGSYGSVIRMTIPWGSIARFKTQDYGGMYGDTVVAAQFTVPSSPATYTNVGYDAWAEWIGPPTLRHMTLSASACDFRPADPLGITGPFAESGGTTPNIYFNAGGGPGGTNLKPGGVYYFNLKNTNCPSGQCNASTTVAWPRN